MIHIEYTAEQAALQPKLAPANINPDSFLATDYLNHYNEVVMLLEMIPDMPDMVEDAAGWQPKSYSQHFIDSGFQGTNLAIEAFDLAPAPIKISFNHVCGKIDKLVLSTVEGLLSLNVVERGLSTAAQNLIRQRVLNAKELLIKLTQVVNGHIEDSESFVAAVNLLGSSIPKTEQDHDIGEVQTQDDIDKLFD
ncbi:MAG: hypothetical protein KUG56_08890 [Kordiimonadaceae bacterium]|nr:hypothetical protein [Kordiimonadaceae bacterium]